MPSLALTIRSLRGYAVAGCSGKPRGRPGEGFSFGLPRFMENPMIRSCPECGGQLSDKAGACPHCGNRLLLASLQRAQSVAQTRSRLALHAQRKRSRSVKSAFSWFVLLVALVGVLIWVWVSVSDEANAEHQRHQDNEIIMKCRGYLNEELRIDTNKCFYACKGSGTYWEGNKSRKCPCCRGYGDHR